VSLKKASRIVDIPSELENSGPLEAAISTEV